VVIAPARRASWIASLIASVMAAVACGGGGGALDSVPQGTWGGEHVGLVVDGAGAAVDLDCAHGQITVPMRLEPDGSFSLPGYYVWDIGPTENPENRQPATYSGRTDGQRLTLSFVLLDDGSGDGPFTAFLGAEPQLQECR
jgi:hypothetical protein